MADIDRVLVFLDAEFYRERVGAVQILEALEAQAVIAPSLGVFISHASIEARWVECPCHAPFARFIDEEFFPWLERLYPRIGAFEQRVIAGLSYTGLAAAYVAMRAPARFTKVIAQSGSFWWNDCWIVGEYRGMPNRLPADFYLDVGREETHENVRHKEDVLQVVSQLDGVRRFRDTLLEKGCTPKYVEFEGGHDFSAWSRTLPAALRWALAP